MADSRDKGKRGEYQVRDLLTEKTALEWARVPGSGGFGSQHGLKGDVYLPTTTGKMSKYAIEVKWYKDEQLNSTIMKKTSSQLDKWLDQTFREADQMSAKPMLIFKKDRGNWLVALEKHETDDISIPDPSLVYKYNDREILIVDFKEFLSTISTEFLVK